MDTSPGEITRLLEAMRSGDQQAEAELMRIIHPELRRLAAGYLRYERPGHTMQATELVNELYLRLAGRTGQIENSAHLKALAARGMRSILIDHARARRAEKRGGAAAHVDLDGLQIGSSGMDEKIMSLEEALLRLSHWDERQARIVELRFFGGMTEDEIGDVLGISARTVKRDWQQARAWLYAEIGG